MRVAKSSLFVPPHNTGTSYGFRCDCILYILNLNLRRRPFIDPKVKRTFFMEVVAGLERLRCLERRFEPAELERSGERLLLPMLRVERLKGAYLVKNRLIYSEHRWR
ncbi:hypothetical protein Y032_0031g2409 [Ancylostoma ceylanicum]|uniref:Uncharacterized protein n=1 Tax=Ancylostoma ceylanicum TaxID=53326 RepID=A0A016UQY8_9BILA|nr:hypothetical protein Y032_0031g2409 [Ancylostoma ceylanicum]